MASSFNFDLDKYLDKRKGKEDIESTRVPVSRKKKPTGKLAALMKLKDALKSLLDADEVLNIENHDDKSNVSIYHKRSFSDKLTDFVTKSNAGNKKNHSDKNNISKPIDKDNNSLSSENNFETDSKFDDDNENNNSINNQQFISKKPINDEFLIKKQIEDDSISRESSQNFFGTHAKDDTISKEAIDKIVRESGSTYVSANTRSEFRNDLREIVKINYRVIKKLPPETIKAFRESADFKQFVLILDKYDLIKHKHKDTD